MVEEVLGGFCGGGVVGLFVVEGLGEVGVGVVEGLADFVECGGAGVVNFFSFGGGFFPGLVVFGVGFGGGFWFGFLGVVCLGDSGGVGVAELSGSVDFDGLGAVVGFGEGLVGVEVLACLAEVDGFGDFVESDFFVEVGEGGEELVVVVEGFGVVGVGVEVVSAVLCVGGV